MDFCLGELTPIFGLWQHCGLCMTVPCLESSQGSYRLWTGVVIVLSMVMERSSGGGKVSESPNIHPIYILVLLVFKENSSQPIFGIFCGLHWIPHWCKWKKRNEMLWMFCRQKLDEVVSEWHTFILILKAFSFHEFKQRDRWRETLKWTFMLVLICQTSYINNRKLVRGNILNEFGWLAYCSFHCPVELAIKLWCMMTGHEDRLGHIGKYFL